jgi:pimeloyl-ACP methyl ester carboxylesterase
MTESGGSGMTTQRYTQERENNKRKRSTSRDGTPIAYRRSGEGPPLVLVHGAAADHGRWRPVLPAFEERFTVYAIDRRGRGGQRRRRRATRWNGSSRT